MCVCMAGEEGQFLSSAFTLLSPCHDPDTYWLQNSLIVPCLELLSLPLIYDSFSSFSSFHLLFSSSRTQRGQPALLHLHKLRQSSVWMSAFALLPRTNKQFTWDDNSQRLKAFSPERIMNNSFCFPQLQRESQRNATQSLQTSFSLMCCQNSILTV